MKMSQLWSQLCGFVAQQIKCQKYYFLKRKNLPRKFLKMLLKRKKSYLARKLTQLFYFSK